MASGVDQVVGIGLVFFSLMLFTYYSVWVLVLPFVDKTHVVHTLFLPREYSVIIPGVAAVLLLSFIGILTLTVIWKNNKSKKIN